MAAQMQKVEGHPGIFRRGGRYVFSYRDQYGKQKWESCRTLREADLAKARRKAQVADGDYHAASSLTFREYADEWLGRYQGRGPSGVRDETRAEYRRDLERYAFRFFGQRKLSQLGRADVVKFVAWLCDQPGKRKGSRLSDQSVRRIVAPLKVCLASAHDEELIRANPAQGVRLPKRQAIDHEDEQDARPLTRPQLDAFLQIVNPRHRLLFQFLAETGLRWGEVAGLEWRHVELDGSRPVVKVRQRLRHGKLGPPKSKYARRTVPLSFGLVRALRIARGVSGDQEPVFANRYGGRLDHSLMTRDVLKPAREELDLPWVGFHTFRHTSASMLFQAGRNAVQVQRWLGHHKASFTLDTYIHLMDDGLGEPLDLAGGVNRVQTEASESERNADPLQGDEAALLSEIAEAA